MCVLGQSKRQCAEDLVSVSRRDLSTAYSPTNQAFTYGYDRYGNRWSQTATQGSGPQPQFSFNANNNRIDQYAYDAAGNVTSDGIHSYAYDAEGNQVTVEAAARRRTPSTRSITGVRRISGSAIDDYGYDLAGKRASRWDGTTAAASLIQAYVNWNGSRSPATEPARSSTGTRTCSVPSASRPSTTAHPWSQTKACPSVRPTAPCRRFSSPVSGPTRPPTPIWPSSANTPLLPAAG